MRVGSTGPVIYLTGQSQKVTGQTCLYLGRLVGSWSSYFSHDVVLSGFVTGVFLRGVRAKKYKYTATHAWAISPARNPGPPDPPATSDPTSDLVIYAVSGPGNQPSGAASGSKPTTGALDLSSGAAIREDALSAAVCLLLPVLLLCCCCCFDDACSWFYFWLHFVLVC